MFRRIHAYNRTGIADDNAEYDQNRNPKLYSPKEPTDPFETLIKNEMVGWADDAGDVTNLSDEDAKELVTQSRQNYLAYMNAVGDEWFSCVSCRASMPMGATKCWANGNDFSCKKRARFKAYFRYVLDEKTVRTDVVYAEEGIGEQRTSHPFTKMITMEDPRAIKSYPSRLSREHPGSQAGEVADRHAANV